MIISNEVRQAYQKLRIKADAVYNAAEPQRLAYDQAMEPYHDIMAKIDDLVQGYDVDTCEGCGAPIFEGDKYHVSSDGNLCVACSPTYGDMLDAPRNFLNADVEPMTAEEAKTICDAHVAEGGKLTDTLAHHGGEDS